MQQCICWSNNTYTYITRKSKSEKCRIRKLGKIKSCNTNLHSLLLHLNKSICTCTYNDSTFSTHTFYISLIPGLHILRWWKMKVWYTCLHMHKIFNTNIAEMMSHSFMTKTVTSPLARFLWMDTLDFYNTRVIVRLMHGRAAASSHGCQKNDNE